MFLISHKAQPICRRPLNLNVSAKEEKEKIGKQDKQNPK